MELQTHKGQAGELFLFHPTRKKYATLSSMNSILQTMKQNTKLSVRV